ncbi:MAG: aldose epimerase family protein [Enterococcus italicus]
MRVEKKAFGTQGEYVYQLTNDHDLTLRVTNYGARVVSLKWEKAEQEVVIIPGFASAAEYRKQDVYFGATIGRVAGRIANAKAELNGQEYQFDKVEGPHSHHGGFQGFHNQLWQATYTIERDQIHFIFSYTSVDGESGYPGKLNVAVHYYLTNTNEWRIQYEAKSDQDTFFNPTNHAYFYTGLHEKTNHAVRLHVKASRYTPIQSDGIPLTIASVANTAFDLRDDSGVDLLACLASEDEQIRLVAGIDHGFVLDKREEDEPAVWLDTPHYRLKMFTDRPSTVIYTFNGADEHRNMDTQLICQHDVIAFETQVLPDAVHHDNFGNVILKNNELFHSTTSFQFLIK